jgi:hypothetical protein
MINRDDPGRSERKGQRIASGTRPNVEPDIARLQEGNEHVENSVPNAVGIIPESLRNRGIEIGSIRGLAERVHLVPVRHDPPPPGGEQFIHRRA